MWLIWVKLGFNLLVTSCIWGFVNKKRNFIERKDFVKGSIKFVDRYYSLTKLTKLMHILYL